MDKLIAQFSNQIKEAIEIGKTVQVDNKTDFHNVLTCGLGGSGIGAKIAKLLFSNKANIPFDTVNDYHIPAYVDEKTLVIATSYSGNTEETLIALEKCKAKGATIVAITSGGSLLKLAETNNWTHYTLPGGEQPRAMLAYSLIQHMYVLKGYGIINEDFESQLIETVELIKKEENQIKSEAKILASQLIGKTPIIYSDPIFEGVAVRFRQQINENSKMLCSHAVIPEMNHNELVGWAGGNEDYAVIKLSSKFEFYRTSKRWEFCKVRISKITPHIFEISAKGESIIVEALYLTHLTDWVSYYIAELKNIDPIEVNVITSLKSELSKLK